MKPSDALRQWLHGNPAAPASLRYVVSKMVSFHDADALWAEFAQHGDVVNAVCHDVRVAWDAQKAEMRRQPPKEESDALALVGKRLKELRDAIEAAPLPKAWSTIATITAEGMPDVPLRVGWRDLPDSRALSAFGYPITVLEVLDLASRLLDQHRVAMPARAVGKHKRDGRPDIKSFVTQLDHLLAARFSGQPMHGAVAHIVNALFDLVDEPKDASAIRDMLRTSSDEWRQGVKRRDRIA